MPALTIVAVVSLALLAGFQPGYPVNWLLLRAGIKKKIKQGLLLTTVFVFALTLLLAVLISQLAERTILSTAVLFLTMGLLVGPGVLGFIPVDPRHPLVERMAELALFSVLFTDGMKVRFRALVAGWELPTLALAVGLPLTLLGTAGLARLLGGLSWVESLLVGAVLAPPIPSSPPPLSAG